MHDSQSEHVGAANQTPDVHELIDQHQLKIWRYLRSLGCDDNLADDLTQDTFVAILRRPFEVVSDAATAVYLRRVAYHLLIDHRRKHRRTTLLPNVDSADQLWMKWIGFASEDEIFEYLKTCYERLTERAQLALQMRFRQHASRESIAEALKISPNGTKNLMQRAKLQLKECIETQIKTRRGEQ